MATKSKVFELTPTELKKKTFESSKFPFEIGWKTLAFSTAMQLTYITIKISYVIDTEKKTESSKRKEKRREEVKRRETYAGKNCLREKILLLGYKTLDKKRAENHAEHIHYLNVFRTRNESHGCSHQGEDLKVVTQYKIYAFIIALQN